MLKIKYVNILVLLLWFSILGILLHREYISGEIKRFTVSEDIFKKTTIWYEIYKGINKIGFASSIMERIGDDFIFKNERYLKMEKHDDSTIKELIRTIVDSSYTPKSFEYSLMTQKERINIKGDIKDEDIIFFVELPDKRFTKKLALEGKKFYFPTVLIPLIHQNITQSKDSSTFSKVFTVTTIDIKGLKLIDTKASLEEIIPVKAGINVLSVFKYRIGNSLFFVNEHGLIIKEVHPDMVYYISDEKRAKDFDTPRLIFDYTLLKPLRSEILISYPENLNLLEIQIKGFSPDPGMYKDSMVSIDKNILVIKKAELKKDNHYTYTLPYNDIALEMHLMPDAWVRSDYEDLKRTGQIYASSENNDAMAFAKYLTSYLFKLVSTQPEFIIPDSKKILDYRRGDSIERSLLFASYSRGAGLPTRLIGGIVYRNGYFFFHVWPEIWLNAWIPVDPSMYQFPADVTHIPLVTGSLDEILSITGLLNKIEIKILNAI